MTDMTKQPVKELPAVQEVLGLSFEPNQMMVTVQYRAVRTPETICQIRFHLQAADKLTGWLVEMLERLTGDLEYGRRLRALQLRGELPKSSG